MKPCHHAMPKEGCRICYLALTDPRYQKMWGVLPDPIPTAGQIKSHQGSKEDGLLCVRLGAETRRTPCKSCAGTVQVKVFSCPLHTECTIVKPVDGIH